MILKVKNISEIGGVVKAPPSKSYSHRAVILASLAQGTSKLYDMLYSEDTLASIRVCEALGAKFTKNDNYLEPFFAVFQMVKLTISQSHSWTINSAYVTIEP